jgi:hypothetical protein
MAFLITVIVAALVLRVAFAGRRSPARTKYRYTGMLLLVGVPGSGKSYKMLELLLRRLAEGRHVMVNFNLRYDRVFVALQRMHHLTAEEARAALRRIRYLDTFEDIVEALDTDVFIDEAQDMLSSADWHLFPQPVVNWFAQHRHRGCRVVLASHRWGSIQNYVRELVSDVELARPAPWYARLGMLLFARGRPLLQYVSIKEAADGATPASGPSATKKRNPLLSLSVTVLEPVVASCYDTHGGVRESPMSRLRRERSKDGDVIVLKVRSSVVGSSSATDGLPELSYQEHIDAVRVGLSPHRIVDELFNPRPVGSVPASLF